MARGTRSYGGRTGRRDGGSKGGITGGKKGGMKTTGRAVSNGPSMMKAMKAGKGSKK